MTDKTQTGFKIDAETLEKAKANCEHGELSEELRRTVKQLAYGNAQTRREELKEELAQLRDDRREKKREMEQKRSKLNEIDRRIEQIEQELDQLRDTKEEYQGMLETMESDLQQGIRIIPTMDKVEKAAEVSGKTAADVIQDLKDRNPDVPDEAYREAKASESGRWRKPKRGKRVQ